MVYIYIFSSHKRSCVIQLDQNKFVLKNIAFIIFVIITENGRVNQICSISIDTIGV